MPFCRMSYSLEAQTLCHPACLECGAVLDIDALLRRVAASLTDLWLGVAEDVGEVWWAAFQRGEP
jgi:hypothetical protein